MPDFHVAIIGAGLSGLALALALHQHSIACTIYEAREAPLDTGGGLMLTPNGLKVLQAIGVYDALVHRAFAFTDVYVQLGTTGAIVETIEYGSEAKYGMRALRAHRYTVLEVLLARVHQLGIPIHFNRRFSHVLSETHQGVSWQFVDGGASSASILVGADGIHSTVRRHLTSVRPAFGGVVTLVAAVPTANLGLPAEDLADLTRATNKHPLPSGIVVPGYGGFVSAPQTRNGDELMITVMRPFPDEPEHWGPMDADKDRLRAMFRENADKFPEAVQRAVTDIPAGQLHVWPFYTMPVLESWTSARFPAGGSEGEEEGREPGGSDGEKGGTGRVAILGDAAHALAPSAGQGANMAFEDIYLFAGVLGRLAGGDGDPRALRAALRGWQLFRQERVDRVIRLNKLMEVRRLPAAQQKERGMDPESLKGNLNEDFEALFRIDLDEAVDECLRKGNDQ